jgi:hypothetical protein
MASPNLYNRRADLPLYVVDYLFGMKGKANNADAF